MKPTERLNIEWDEDTLPSGRRFVLWILVCLFGLSSLIFCFIYHPLFHPELKVGDAAYQDLRATIEGEVEDIAATKQAQLRARNSVVPIFKPAKGQDEKFAQDMQNELAKIKNLQGKIYGSNTKMSEGSENTKGPEYYELYIASAVPAKQFDSFAQQFNLRALKVNRALPRFSVQDSSFWLPAVEEFLPDEWSSDLKKQSALLICHFLSPTLIIDEDATYAKAEQIAAAIQPVMRKVESGTVLLKKGETVTESNLPLLELLE